MSEEEDQTDAARLAYRRRLGLAITRFRDKGHNWTQEQFAGLMGVDKNTISRWENAQTEMKAYDLARVIKKLAVPCDWLLTPTDSISELDERLAQLREAAGAAESAQWQDGEGGSGRAGGGGRASGPGRRPA